MSQLNNSKQKQFSITEKDIESTTSNSQPTTSASKVEITRTSDKKDQISQANPPTNNLNHRIFDKDRNFKRNYAFSDREVNSEKSESVAQKDENLKPTGKSNSSDPNKPVKKKKKNWFVRILLSLLLIIVAMIAILAILLVPPALSIMDSLQNIEKEAETLKDDIKGKNFTQLPTRTRNIQFELQNVRSQMDKFDFLANIGFIQPYYENVNVGKEILDNTDLLIEKALPKIKIFSESLDATVKARVEVENAQSKVQISTPDTSINTTTNSEALTPVAPVLSNAQKCKVELTENVELQEKGVDVEKYVENKTEEVSTNPTKLRDIITVLPEAIDIYTEVEPEMQIVLHSVNKLDMETLPPYIPQKYIDKLSALLTTTKEYETNFPKYTELIKNLLVGVPELLGSKKPVTYLIVFQNEKEMRASGGLLTAYGLVTVDKGSVVGDIETHDMWDLQGDIWRYSEQIYYYNIYGQLVLMNDGCGASELRSQDSGIYPDQQISMEMFTEYYNDMQRYLPQKYKKYDYVLTLNTFFASDMISVIEPLVLDDCTVITSDNLAKVIFNDRNDDGGRKSNIGRVAKAAEDEFTSISSDKLPDVLTTLIKTAQAKNFAFYTKNEVMSKFFDDMGLTGRIVTDFEGDYLHVNEAQVCGLKANFYLKDTVIQNISIADDGTISRTMKVEWINEKIFDPAEDEIISSSPSFPYRAWIRFMTPDGSDYTYTDGYAKSRWLYYPQDYYDLEVQKSVSDNVIWFNHRRYFDSEPVPTYDLNISYTLPEKIKYTSENGYKMLIQKHPGKQDEKYIVGMNYQGESYHIEFILDRDKVVLFKDGQLKVENYPHPLDDYNWMLDNLVKQGVLE
jgi:hypothetical protein